MAITDRILSGLGLTSPKMRKPTEGFSINEFRSNVLNKGILKNNLYLVRFQFGKFPEELVFYTNSVQIPAADLATADIRRYGYGPLERVPYRPIFNDMTMDFYTEASSKSALEVMMKKISGTANFMNYKDFATDSTNPYEVAYKNDISFDIEVYIYNENTEKIITYNFRECFARQVGSIQLSWESENSLLKTNVGFSFTDFSVNMEDAVKSDNINKLSPLQKILQLGTIAQTISAIKRPQSVGDAINILNNANVVKNGLGL
jgi:hypothetical protein